MSTFKPIRTIESKLSTIPVVDGNLILCIDTGNTYMDGVYGSQSVIRRQAFPKHTLKPVDLLIKAGNLSGLDDIGDIGDEIVDGATAFVKEVEAYYYFDADSTTSPNGTTIIRPDYITSGPGRWKQFTSTGPEGPPGTPIVWRGEFGSAPGSPVVNNAYRNTSLKGSYVYDGSSWKMMVKDGEPGANGASPTIGDNGNWYIGGQDTGVSASGSGGGINHMTIDVPFHYSSLNLEIVFSNSEVFSGTALQIKTGDNTGTSYLKVSKNDIFVDFPNSGGLDPSYAGAVVVANLPSSAQSKYVKYKWYGEGYNSRWKFAYFPSMTVPSVSPLVMPNLEVTNSTGALGVTNGTYIYVPNSAPFLSWYLASGDERAHLYRESDGVWIIHTYALYSEEGQPAYTERHFSEFKGTGPTPWEATWISRWQDDGMPDPWGNDGTPPTVKLILPDIIF